MPPEIFYCYARSEEDEELRVELDKQLALMKANGVIKTWSRRDLLPGQQRKDQIDSHVRSAQIILILVSPDLMASEENFKTEIAVAMDRQSKGEAIVIPILLRFVDSWSRAPFGELEPLPSNGVPVKKWADRDEALSDVARGIRKIIESFKFDGADTAEAPTPLAERNAPKPRVVDAAIPSHIVKDIGTELLVLVRLPESQGLRGKLQQDDEAAARPKDVRSESFNVRFPIGRTGKPETLKMTAKLIAPDFSPPSQEKDIFVPPDADSSVYSFLLMPTKVGKLRVVVEIAWQEGGRDRRLVTTCVSTANEIPAEPEMNLVQMEVGVRSSEQSVRLAEPRPETCSPLELPPPPGPSRYPPYAPEGYHPPSPRRDAPPPTGDEERDTRTPPREVEGAEGDRWAPRGPEPSASASGGGHTGAYSAAPASVESPASSAWKTPTLLAALVTLVGTLTVGYWQWIYKPNQRGTLNDVVLTGQILNSKNQEFVRGARVGATLNDSPRQFEQFTDSTGNYSIALGEVKKNTIGSISVRQSQFQPLQENFTVADQTVRVDLRIDPVEGPRPHPNVIAGRVVNAASNVGLGQATISLAGRTEYVRTDDNGNFRMQLNPPFPRDAVRLQIKRTGCSDVIDLQVRPPAENLVFELHCTASVR